ncbi:RHS repeat-associated core domain-containing protein [Xanthomonas bundabergensis]|uniref:RHS repeat-associated core domain-containing protein n=1 Tax=Xanthomonas bundabergensis TaxID=3160842 RepID=UPI003510D9EF
MKRTIILMFLPSLFLVAAAHAQTVIYYHTDALGTPVAVTDASGNVVERSEYEPYGSLLNRPLTDGPGYAGHVMDAGTGLAYMQQRYYDPGVGKMLSVDPVTAYDNEDMRHFNVYAYAYNNPYKFNDPDGRVGKLYWSASNRVTYTVHYVLTGVTSPVSAAQINSRIAQDYSGTVNVNGINVTVTAQAIQEQNAGSGINTVNVVQNTAGVTQSGRSETNSIGGNQITIGKTGQDAATSETVSHELGGHAGGAGDQYSGGVGANGVRLSADVAGPANVMKDLSGQPANSQTLSEIINAPTNVNTCAPGVTAANGGC